MRHGEVKIMAIQAASKLFDEMAKKEDIGAG